MRHRLGLWLGIVGLLGACERDGRTTEPPGLRTQDGTPLARQPPSAAPTSPANRSDSREPGNGAFGDSPGFGEPSAWEGAPGADFGEGNGAAAPSASSALVTGSADPAPDPAKPQRDLARELTTALGPPARCVDLARVAQHGGRIEIQIEAMVMPSGRISRATVSAPHQAPETVRCLETHLLSGSLPADVPGAPVRVKTTVPVEVVAQAPTPAAPPGASPPPNTRTPAGDEIARPDGTEFARPSD